MRRVLFTWRGIEFHSYPVLLYLGLLGGLVAGNRAAHALGLPAGRVFIAQLTLIPLALAGSRLLYVLLHLPYYRSAPRRLLRVEEGGADMFGGLPVVLLASLPIAALLDLPFWRFWDVTAFTLFGGMLIVRFGCLLNGCCCGRPTESRWGLLLPNTRGILCRRIPMQLLEIGWTVVVVGLAFALAPRSPIAGTLFVTTAGAYCLGRFVLDPGREERHPGIGPLTANQGMYGATSALCALWLVLVAMP